jgi:hypothetical protein
LRKGTGDPAIPADDAERGGGTATCVDVDGAAGKITEVQVGKRAVRIDVASVEAHILASQRPSREAA